MLSTSALYKGTVVGIMEVELQSFLTTALDWHECTPSCPSCFRPEEITPVNNGLRSGSGGSEKEKNLLFRPGIEQETPADRSLASSIYRLSFLISEGLPVI